jgi:hypothetical protein
MSDPGAISTTDPALRTLEPSLSVAIERLRLSSDVQDLTGLPKPVRFTDGSWRQRLARRLVASLRARATTPETGGLVDDAVRCALRMVAVGRRGWTAPSGAKINPQTPAPFAGYVTSSTGEDQVVRLSLLLRLMKRRREAVDLLERRVVSVMPSEQSRFWLSQMLLSLGEKKLAARLAPAVTSPVPPGPRAPRPASRLRYGIVVLTMFDSPVFRSSLQSLVQSDYSGRIVVVEDAYEPAEQCRAYCQALGVTYLKRASYMGSTAMMNEGIASMADDVDIVTFAHNDILWPTRWFLSLDRAWDAVFDGGHVGLLNLGYLQFKHKIESTLTELFVRGEYDHLSWILTASRRIPFLKNDRIQDAQVRGGERLFGLARDCWNDWTLDARFMTGRFSIGASFPVATWRALGGFDERLAHGFDLMLQQYCLTNHKWMLFTNNPPLIHLASSDTRWVDPARTAAASQLQGTIPLFEEMSGWQIDHFLNLYFSESAFIFQDEIVRAANSNRFEDIDFVFDDFQQRLRERTLENCELTWCRNRSTCGYTDSSVAAVVAPPDGLRDSRRMRIG